MMYLSLCFISLVFLFSVSCLSLALSVYFVLMDMVILVEWEMFSLNSCTLPMIIYVDWMSLMFFFLVTFISSMVIFYSDSYMVSDLFLDRFIYMVLLFVASMILLIFSLNLISLLLGWDGLGLVSYCLVIYYQNPKSFNSGMLTALSNRIGDVMILMGIAWMVNVGSWNFMSYSMLMMDSFVMMVIMVFIMLAAMTKSAQVPFSAWLPAAMAAPTPVSALVHSSTLVTAGVYLLVRFKEFFMFEGLIMFLFFSASLTMFMAGLSANFEIDLKKIIALSTLSQLGLMMGIFSMGYSVLAFFHLLTHAMFKALLFMCAGLIIHSMSNFQDIRFMGGVGKYMPLVSFNLNVSNLALCGMPFLSGFYSKDLILESMLVSNINKIFFFFFFFSTGLTVCYSLRLLVLSLWGQFNFFSLFSLADNDYIMVKSMGGLLIMSVLLGGSLSWLIMPIPFVMSLSLSFKLLVLFILLGGVMLGVMILSLKLKGNYSLLMLMWMKFIFLMWFIPSVSVYGFNLMILNLSIKFNKIMDQGWWEACGGQFVYKELDKVANISYNINLNSIKVFMFIYLLFFYVLVINII
uniref:NADH dehydrogenase subunit 5 n=1 Tax=Diplectrona albofasciata TaxID=2566535 RepID=UPI0022382639|nr:NADH dehydrogenase subunit 5 [Diplectrona albofasciata]UYO79234.1 NADH dehydrogenase subunit 5 [Diplectrona albofasciata]